MVLCGLFALHVLGHPYLNRLHEAGRDLNCDNLVLNVINLAYYRFLTLPPQLSRFLYRHLDMDMEI